MQTIQQEHGPEQTGRTIPDTNHLCREWGWMAFRGILAIILGFVALISPFATIWALAILWGAFALTDGVLAGYTSWRLYKKGVRWWPYALFAVTGVLAGIAALLLPGITALVLIIIIGCWAVMGGVSEIVAAIRLRKEIEGEWRLIFAGAVSTLFGLLLLFKPAAFGVVAIAWIVSFYAFITGSIFLMLAYELRKKCRA